MREHDRNAVALGLVVQLAARHPQDRHNAIVAPRATETRGSTGHMPPSNGRAGVLSSTLLGVSLADSSADAWALAASHISTAWTSEGRAGPVPAQRVAA